MRWLIPFLFCSFAVLLPWRLRILFANAVAWWAQAVYFLSYVVLKALIKSLAGGEKSRERNYS